MIPIGEAIERLESIYNKGVKSKDSRLSSRLVYSALLSGRSELIRQMSNKNQYLGDWIYQTLYKVELEYKPVNTANIGLKIENILKGKKQLPKLVSDMDSSLIRSVSDLENNSSFSITSWANNKYNQGNQYTANKPRFYIRDGYPYITQLKLLPAITLEAVFEDPLEVYTYNLDNFTDCPDCQCKAAKDIDFPIDRNLITPMLKLAYTELIILMSQMVEDRNNNAADDTSAAGKMIHQPQEG